MITFTCPACSGKCQVADEFGGRKMRCPKCATRIRHHKDGTIELLTVGKPPPASAPPPAASAEPPKKETTVQIGIVTEVAGKLLTQKESKQNALIAWGVVGFIAVSLSVVGLVMGDLKLAVAPVALALVAGFVALAVRAKRRPAPPPPARPAKPPVKDEEKTEPLPKL